MNGHADICWVAERRPLYSLRRRVWRDAKSGAVKRREYPKANRGYWFADGKARTRKMFKNDAD